MRSKTYESTTDVPRVRALLEHCTVSSHCMCFFLSRQEESELQFVVRTVYRSGRNASEALVYGDDYHVVHHPHRSFSANLCAVVQRNRLATLYKLLEVNK
jgi:hypothetical protein